MATLSVREFSVKCLGVLGTISLRGDVLGAPAPPARSLRNALEFIHKHRCRPAAPTNLQSTFIELTRAFGLLWVDNADNEDGFRVRFRGRKAGEADHEGTRTVDGADQHSTLIRNVRGGFAYTFSVVAFNPAGESSPSNEVTATVPSFPENKTVQLAHQVVAGPTVYAGEFPSQAGIPPSGRLLAIRLPRQSFVPIFLNFLKFGHTAQNCGNASAVVTLGEDESTTPQELEQIFGQEEPSFGFQRSIRFVACFSSSEPVTSVPNFIRIEITVLEN